MSAWRRMALIAAALGTAACRAMPLSPEPPAPAMLLEQERAARVVASLVPVVHVSGAREAKHSLRERMDRFHVPGVSVAVADGDELVWARGYGVIELGKPELVTDKTLFQAASISKAVTATATMRLVELGKLSLDEDVNEYLHSWRLPESELLATQKVTLRRLLSHTAGVNVHGFLGYQSTDPLPTTLQILKGEKPANTAAISVTSVPGSELSYSGGGTMIEQLVLTDTTKKAFPQLMRELVLVPAGMRESTFEQPPTSSAAAQAATAHDASGQPLPGRFMIYPELAAAGLWSTPSDLLAWAMAVSDARAGRPLSLLSKASAQAMLTPQKGPLGLGPFVRGKGRAQRFGHAGWADGFHAEVWYFPELGKGAAVMVNGAGGRPMLREILNAIAVEYGWPDFAPDTIERVAVDAGATDAIAGSYGATVEGAKIEARIRRDGESIHLESSKLGLSSEIVFVSKTSFVVLDSGDEFALKVGSEGDVEALEWGGIVLPRVK